MTSAIPWLPLLVAAALSFLLALLGTPLAISAAKSTGFMDSPAGSLKTHREPTPYLGGMALFVPFLTAAALAFELDAKFLGILLAATLAGLGSDHDRVAAGDLERGGQLRQLSVARIVIERDLVVSEIPAEVGRAVHEQRGVEAHRRATVRDLELDLRAGSHVEQVAVELRVLRERAVDRCAECQRAVKPHGVDAVCGTVADARLSSNVALLAGTQAVTGVKTFNPNTGTVPFAVDPTKNSVVANLNADRLDGVSSESFALLTTPTGGDLSGALTSATVVGLRNIGLLNVDRIARGLATDLAGLMSEVEAERRR